MEFLAGLSCLAFVGFFVYVFWMHAEEQKDIGE